jgi:hypothetical protein
MIPYNSTLWSDVMLRNTVSHLQLHMYMQSGRARASTHIDTYPAYTQNMTIYNNKQCKYGSKVTQ